MRIAYMLTTLGIGGAEKQVVALAERMEARGHDVALIVLRARVPREWHTDVSVVRLDMRRSPASIFGGVIRARRFLRGFRPNILHSHTFPANMMARTLRAASAVRIVVSTIHNVYEGGHHRTLAYRLTDPFVTHTTAVSQAVADRYVEIGAVPRGRCSVLTNGIDVDEFAPRLDGVSRVRELALTEKQFVWLCAGRPVPAKDFNNLMAAFRRVRDLAPNTQLWIAGELNEKDVRIDGKAFRNRQCEVDGLRWLGFREDMAAAIGPADGFVLGSAWEGMPLVVGEAMVMEKPVVATDVGGVRELVGQTGILVPSKNPQALADAMLRIMEMSGSERAEMGRAARARIVQNFNMNVKAAEWESLYTRVLHDEQTDTTDSVGAIPLPLD